MLCKTRFSYSKPPPVGWSWRSWGSRGTVLRFPLRFLPCVHQVTLHLSPPLLKGFFCACHGDPFIWHTPKGAVAQGRVGCGVWAAARPQRRVLGDRCSLGLTCPRSESSAATRFSTAFCPLSPTPALPLEAICNVPQEKSFVLMLGAHPPLGVLRNHGNIPGNSPWTFFSSPGLTNGSGSIFPGDFCDPEAPWCCSALSRALAAAGSRGVGRGVVGRGCPAPPSLQRAPSALLTWSGSISRCNSSKGASNSTAK